MTILLGILLLFYICIVVSRVISSVRPKKRWSLNLDLQQQVSESTCDTDLDCHSLQKCFRNQCVTVRKSRECHPETGMWVQEVDGLTCVCKYPQLIGQVTKGDNCDVGLACKPYGYLADVTVNPLVHGRCLCKSGYVADRDSRKHPICRKSRLEDRPPCHPYPFDATRNECQCPSGWIDSDSLEAELKLSLEYRKLRKRCLRDPCTFDVRLGLKLDHGFYVPSTGGCFCDPRYGNVGVVLRDLDPYLRVTGVYNACMNLIDQERSIPVKIYAYFYYGNRKPVTFVRFGSPNVVYVADLWDTGVFQYLMKNVPAKVHSRECYNFPYHCKEWLWRNEAPRNCSFVLDVKRAKNMVPSITTTRVRLYELVYKYILCHMDDPESPYYQQVVINPYLTTLDFSDYTSLRSNGLVIDWDGHELKVDLAATDYDYLETKGLSMDTPGDKIIISDLY